MEILYIWMLCASVCTICIHLGHNSFCLRIPFLRFPSLHPTVPTPFARVCVCVCKFFTHIIFSFLFCPSIVFIYACMFSFVLYPDLMNAGEAFLCLHSLLFRAHTHIHMYGVYSHTPKSCTGHHWVMPPRRHPPRSAPFADHSHAASRRAALPGTGICWWVHMCVRVSSASRLCAVWTCVLMSIHSILFAAYSWASKAVRCDWGWLWTAWLDSAWWRRKQVAGAQCTWGGACGQWNAPGGGFMCVSPIKINRLSLSVICCYYFNFKFHIFPF